MKNKIIILKGVLIVALTSLLSLNISNAHAASVSSLSREETVKINGQDYIQVSVRCGQSTKSREIVRKDDSSPWCSGINPDYCFKSKSKITAAQKTCKNNYFKNVEAATQRNTAKAKTALDTAPVETPTQIVAPTENNVQAITQTTTPPAATMTDQERNKLLKEQVQVEEQRILLEQKKLELRVKELKLRKRELETKNN